MRILVTQAEVTYNFKWKRVFVVVREGKGPVCENRRLLN